MNNEIGGRLAELEHASTDFRALMRDITPERFTWSPAPGVWSIGLCIEHLIVVGDLFAQSIDRSVRHARKRQKFFASGSNHYQYGFLGRWFIRVMEPPVKLKARAPRKYVPPSRLTFAEAESRFLSMQDHLRRAFASADGLNLAKVRMRSPATPLIRLQLGVWLGVIAAHERRHICQARRLVQMEAFSKK